MAGWAIFLIKTGILKFVYNWFGKEFTSSLPTALAVGVLKIKINYTHDVVLERIWACETFLTMEIFPTKKLVGRLHNFSMSGETFDVGRNTGSPVGDYPTIPFTGKIIMVVLERLQKKTQLP